MHQEASLTDAIGKALLGFEPGQTEMDFGTLCTRSVTALESVSEPVEAVDLLITVISCLSNRSLDADEHNNFREMAESLGRVWTKKANCSH